MITPRIVAVGASAGGLHAIRTLLGGISSELGCSMVLAQHRSIDSSSRLVELLARSCELPVSEPEDRTPLEPNRIYLAPSDYHLLVEDGCISLSVDEPVCFARPSIDVLFESVAQAYGPACVCIVLTGSNDDGANGAVAIKRAGGSVLVQDPRTAQSPAAPLATLARTRVDAVVRLEELANELIRLCRGNVRLSAAGF